MSEPILLGLVSIIVLGISAQWLAWRLRVPSILLLLTFGFVAGPVTGFIDHDTPLGQLLLPFVSLAAAVIMFEGGLSLKLAELRQVGGAVGRLVTVGLAITWLATSAAAWLILGLEPRLALLLGAVLVVSGPTVIGPMLRQLRLTGRIGPILKWEGIAIDPLGALLALLVYQGLFVSQSDVAEEALFGMLRTLVFGGGMGLAAALLLTWLLRRYWIPDFLQNAVTLMFLLSSFVASNALRPDSGLLAVTVMGAVLANQRWINVEHIIVFKENLRVLLLAMLFILLAARLRREHLLHWAGLGTLAFVVVLIVAVRPLAVWLATLRSRLTGRERLFLAWMAPRGIVAAAMASVLHLYLIERDYKGEDHVLVPVTFAVIVGTVATYGLTAPLLAHRLGLADPDPQGVLLIGAHPWVRALAHVLREHGFPVLLVDNNWSELTAARLEGLHAHYASVHREELLDELDLGGIGRLLALTSNDAVNLLAIERYWGRFGQSEVYRLAPEHEPGAHEHHGHFLHGRLLFGPVLTYQTLEERFEAGAAVKATHFTEAFTYEDFTKQHGASALPLFLLPKPGRLTVIAADQAIHPLPGQTLICLVGGATA
jgi:NhaP-type Na+/H+ or K+/H+ antiporter